APGIECVDHRVLGTWFAHGAEELLRNLRALFDVAADVTLRADDVLALQADAFLVRRMVFGRGRASGGAFERPPLGPYVFGADGLVARWEVFDVDREAEALACFDELTAGPAAVRPVQRRVCPNAATVTAARMDAAIAARDADAPSTLSADEWEVLDHTT